MKTEAMTSYWSQVAAAGKTVVGYTMFTRDFTGTDEERDANKQTHDFGASFDEVRCYECDCRPASRAASWPCRDAKKTVYLKYDDETVVEYDYFHKDGVPVRESSRMVTVHLTNPENGMTTTYDTSTNYPEHECSVWRDQGFEARWSEYNTQG